MSPARGDPPVLLERRDELAQIRELVGAAADGRGGAAALVGPAGIGKTSLLDAARPLAAERGLGCVAARGGEFERDFAYGVVRQLLERPLRRLSCEERAAVLEGAAAPAAEALGLQKGRDAPASDTAFSIVHGLYWACVNLSERRPLLILVDDLHWADLASLRFLAYLVRRLDELPLVLLSAARPTTDAERAALMDAVIAGPEVRTVTPSPLSRQAVSVIVRGVLGAGVDDRVASTCWEVTRGNPFLCEALLSSLGDRSPPAAADVAAAGGRAASSVVLQRLGRLPADATALAQAVVVLGTDADLRHAAALTGLTAERAASAADALAVHGMLQVGRPLEFVHPLVRAAVAEQIPTAERMLAHAHAARVLDAAGAPIDAVAAHLLATEPAGDAWAVECLQAAAAEATTRGAPEAAVAQLRRALHEPPRPDTRVDVLRQLGMAEIHAGDAESGARHLQDAHAESEVPRPDVLFDLVAAQTILGRYADAVAVIEEALDRPDLADEIVLPLKTRLLQMATLEPVLWPRAERRLLDVPAELPDSDPVARDHLAARTTHALLRGATAADVRALAARAAQAGIVEEITSGSFAFNNVVYPLVCADGFELADELTEAAVEVARRRSSAIGYVRAHGARALLRLRRGEVREALADARVAHEAGREGRIYVSVLVLGTLLGALIEQGDLGGARDALRDCGLDGDIPDSFLHNWVLDARGRLHLADGRPADAIADFEELRRRHEVRGQANPGVSAHRSWHALALLRTGDRDGALALADEEAQLARAWGAPRALGLSLRTLGLATGGQRGLELLRASASTLVGSGARLEHARSLVELGAALRRAGRRSDAREELRAGMELAYRCAADPLVEQAREELLATGARPRRLVRTGVDALTPSELRVVHLAARGLTNREIAQALFVTLRTVQVHLTHSYQKLEITSRDQLPAALGAAG